MQKISLLIISSSLAVRKGLVSLFKAQGFFKIVGDVDNVQDLEKIQEIQPDVVLFGFYYDEKNIYPIIKSIKEVCPCTLLIFFSDLREHWHIKTALMAGADGCLKAPILPSDLVTAITLSCRSGICFIPREAKDTILDIKPIPKNHLTVVKEANSRSFNIDQ